jgi:predicted Zn-dependent peptidase
VLSKDGTLKTLKQFSKKKVVDWYKNKVYTAPATLCIVGDIDFQRTIDFIGRMFSKCSFTKDLGHRSIVVSPCEKNKIVVNRGLDQSIINLGGFCMPGRDVELRGGMSVLAQIIGGDINSRMFDLLREKHGIAYSAEFDYDLLNDLGYFDMFTIVDKEKEDFAIELLLKIQADLKRDGVSEGEITKAKNYILGQTLMEEESVLSQAQVISSLLALGYDYEFYLQREDRIKGVCGDGVMKILEEYFNFEDEYLHVLH